MTTAIAVARRTSHRAVCDPIADQPPVGQPRRKHRVRQPVDAEDDADDRKKRVEIDPDVAAQHVEIIEEEQRREQEDADRGGWQQCRPESDGEAAEIGRLLRRRVGVDQPAENAPSAEEEHGRGHERKEGGPEHGLKLELDDEFQPRGNGAVETRIFVMDIVEQLSVEGLRERIALGKHIAEQFAAHQPDLLDQTVDADGQRLGQAEHGVDLGLFGGQGLSFGRDDLRFRLPFRRRRAELLQPGVDLRTGGDGRRPRWTAARGRVLRARA